MGKMKAAHSRLSDDGRPPRRVWAGQRLAASADPLTDLSVLQESLAWEYDAVLTGIYIKVAGSTWQVTVKAEFRSGPQVAFVQGVSLYDAISSVHSQARRSQLSWARDQYPVRVSKRAGLFQSPIVKGNLSQS